MIQSIDTLDSTSVYDVLIIGAGPAGSATACRLARQGLRVALIERTDCSLPRIGESLAPNVQRALRDLGVWSEFVALDPLPSWGTQSLWGADDDLQSQSHLISPYGRGWHVNRSRFDQMLADSAVEAGVDWIYGRYRRIKADNSGWRVLIEQNSPQSDAAIWLRARLLVDATGRLATVSRSLGARRLMLDQLIGIASYCYTELDAIDSASRNCLLVEAVSDGWWYTAPLPSSEPDQPNAVAMLMTDTDICRDNELNHLPNWLARIETSREVCKRMKHVDPRKLSLRIHNAASHRLLRKIDMEQLPWIAVGDAALSVDPISGSGVLRALDMAQLAARTLSQIIHAPKEWRNVLRDYEAEIDTHCTKVLMERAHYYAAEKRFETPFWHRRHKSLNSLQSV